MPSYLARTVSTASGSTASFAFSFPYLNRSHVKVKLDGAPYAGSITFTSPSTIALGDTPAAGVEVTVYRDTPEVSLLATTHSKGVLNAHSINLVSTQLLYRLQEAIDQGTGGLKSNSIEAGEIAGTPQPGYVPIVNDEGDGYVFGLPVPLAAVTPEVLPALTADTLVEAATNLGTKPVFNIMSVAYGGEGDGVEDDSEPFAAVLEDAAEAFGLTYLPANTYKIATTPGEVDDAGLLNVPEVNYSHINIEGDGYDRTVLRCVSDIVPSHPAKTTSRAILYAKSTLGSGATFRIGNLTMHGDVLTLPTGSTAGGSISASAGDGFTIASNVITRAAGGGQSFLVGTEPNLITAGKVIRLSGMAEAANNGRDLLVTNVTATSITVDPYGADLTNEGTPDENAVITICDPDAQTLLEVTGYDYVEIDVKVTGYAGVRNTYRNLSDDPKEVFRRCWPMFIHGNGVVKVNYWLEHPTWQEGPMICGNLSQEVTCHYRGPEDMSGGGVSTPLNAFSWSDEPEDPEGGQFCEITLDIEGAWSGSVLNQYCPGDTIIRASKRIKGSIAEVNTTTGDARTTGDATTWGKGIDCGSEIAAGPSRSITWENLYVDECLSYGLHGFRTPSTTLGRLEVRHCTANLCMDGLRAAHVNHLFGDYIGLNILRYVAESASNGNAVRLEDVKRGNLRVSILGGEERIYNYPNATTPNSDSVPRTAVRGVSLERCGSDGIFKLEAVRLKDLSDVYIQHAMDVNGEDDTYAVEVELNIENTALYTPSIVYQFGDDGSQRMKYLGLSGTYNGDLLSTAPSSAVYSVLTTVKGPGVIVDEFTGDGTWTKRPGARLIEVDGFGPGGGAGGGARTTSGNASSGGSGGGGGSRARGRFAAADVPDTVAVTVPQGGAGGAGSTVDNTAGSDGSTPSGDTTFGSLLTAYRGGRGAGGQLGADSGGGGGGGGIGAAANGVGATAGSASSQTGRTAGGSGAAATGNPTNAGSGGGGGDNAAVGTAGGGQSGNDGGGSGGGSGGGIAASPASLAGGPSGSVLGQAGATGGSAAGAGNNGTQTATGQGTGGSGGGSNASGAGGAGGNGARGGGGGGGGGSAVDGNGGAGGAGGAGFIRVKTFF